jgi:hypothetical protein
VLMPLRGPPVWSRVCRAGAPSRPPLAPECESGGAWWCPSGTPLSSLSTQHSTSGHPQGLSGRQGPSRAGASGGRQPRRACPGTGVRQLLREIPHRRLVAPPEAPLKATAARPPLTSRGAEGAPPWPPRRPWPPWGPTPSAPTALPPIPPLNSVNAGPAAGGPGPTHVRPLVRPEHPLGLTW